MLRDPGIFTKYFIEVLATSQTPLTSLEQIEFFFFLFILKLHLIF